MVISGYATTASERIGYDYDLTHGHPYRTPFEEEMAAIEVMQCSLGSATDMNNVKTSERKFLEAFMAMSRQELQPNEAHFVFPSASLSLFAAATILSETRTPKNG